jgi:hypothetical protein
MSVIESRKGKPQRSGNGHGRPRRWCQNRVASRPDIVLGRSFINALIGKGESRGSFGDSAQLV